MKSLQMSRRKVTNTVKLDHTKGERVYDYTGNWTLDTAGINAKDATDAIVGNIYLMEVYSTSYPAIHTFDPNAIFERTYEEIVKKNTDYLRKMNLVLT